MARLQIFHLCLVIADLGMSHFLSATVGDNISLPCATKDEEAIGAKLYWYKQSLGMKPVLISSFFKYDQKSELHGQFKSGNRFTLDNEKGRNNLHINNVEVSDSAVYQCIRCFLHQTEFLESITVIANDVNSGVEIHQSPAENIDPGDSITLRCTVQYGKCDGQHNVYWFKKTEDSHVGVLYSHGGSRDQCERKTDNSCDYNLPIDNVSSSHMGIYYCAVASCGQVLFGNGTMVNLKHGPDRIFYILSGALVGSFVLIVLLVFSLCVMKKKYNRLSTELKHQASFKRTATANTEGQAEDPDSVNYAALSINYSCRRQRDTVQTECLYSSINQDN